MRFPEPCAGNGIWTKTCCYLAPRASPNRRRENCVCRNEDITRFSAAKLFEQNGSQLSRQCCLYKMGTKLAANGGWTKVEQIWPPNAPCVPVWQTRQFYPETEPEKLDNLKGVWKTEPNRTESGHGRAKCSACDLKFETWWTPEDCLHYIWEHLTRYVPFLTREIPLRYAAGANLRTSSLLKSFHSSQKRDKAQHIGWQL